MSVPNIYLLVESILRQAGLGFTLRPELVLISVFLILGWISGYRVGGEKGLAYGINQQRGFAGAIAPRALNAWNPTWITSVVQFSVYFLTVVYLLWLWGFVYSGLPTPLSQNPFANFQEAIARFGPSLSSNPWLGIIAILVVLADICGRRRGFVQGVEEAIRFQPAAAGVTFGAQWYSRRWGRRIFTGLLTMSTLFISITYILWLWGVQL